MSGLRPVDDFQRAVRGVVVRIDFEDASVLLSAKVMLTFHVRLPGWSAPSISKPHDSNLLGFTAPPVQVMTLSVRFTVHPAGCPVREFFAQRLPGNGRMPTSPADLALRMVNHMVDSYLDLRRLLTRQLGYLQQALFSPHSRYDTWEVLLESRNTLHLLEDTCEDQRSAVVEWIDMKRNGAVGMLFKAKRPDSANDPFKQVSQQTNQAGHEDKDRAAQAVAMKYSDRDRRRNRGPVINAERLHRGRQRLVGVRMNGRVVHSLGDAGIDG